jgi:hypothetical protein
MEWIENCECQIKEWTGDGGFVECCGGDIDIDNKWRDGRVAAAGRIEGQSTLVL